MNETRTVHEQIDAIATDHVCTRCGADLRTATKYIGGKHTLCGDCYRSTVLEADDEGES